jgi:hypothetical protein
MKSELIDNSGDKSQYKITNCTQQELSDTITKFFESHGYTLKSEEGNQFVFTKGNRVLRMLFGAFVKYHKVSAGFTTMGPDAFGVILQRDSTGMSGGVIGMNQVRKEFKKLSADFELFTSF